VAVLYNLPGTATTVKVEALYGAQADAVRIVEVGSSTTYGLDPAGNVTYFNDSANTTTFSYDRLNRLKTETTPFGVPRSYEYDANSRLTRDGSSGADHRARL
jgi:YD repeat-containing protein